MRGRPNDVITRCADEAIFLGRRKRPETNGRRGYPLLQIHLRYHMEPITNPIISPHWPSRRPATIKGSVSMFALLRGAVSLQLTHLQSRAQELNKRQ
jgi:hypothetical protein